MRVVLWCSEQGAKATRMLTDAPQERIPKEWQTPEAWIAMEWRLVDARASAAPGIDIVVLERPR